MDTPEPVPEASAPPGLPPRRGRKVAKKRDDLAPVSPSVRTDLLTLAAREAADALDDLDQDDGSTRLPMVVAATSLANLADEVDLFAHRRALLLAQADSDRARAKALGERARRIDETVAQADRAVLAEIDRLGVDERGKKLPFRGHELTLAAQTNGGKTPVRINITDDAGAPVVKETVTIRHVVDPATALLLEIPEDFLEDVTYTRLKLDPIRAALEAGATIPWATLDRGQRLVVKESK